VTESARASITCPQCERTSHHPVDVREQYCGACHQWHDEMKPLSCLRCGAVMKLGEDDCSRCGLGGQS
jgi:hypothetical protein